jgi:polysaccharide chain length determinant protein (PEP-CTERM system associated)
MPDMMEDQESPKPDFEQYLDILRRRHIYFLVPLFICWALVWGMSWVLPARYVSSTLILVEQPTMPQNYVSPNVNDNLQDRLQSITQQILSRTRLLTIIEKLHLYSGPDPVKNPESKIDMMRKDVDIELVHDTRNNEITAFKVSFSSQDPVLAQKVTNELTQLFINENLKVREEQSEGTTRFIEQQLEDARATLSAQEAKVRQFQSGHEGALPTQQQSNLQILAGLQSQLQNQQDALNSAKQQKVYYQSLIEQYKSLHAAGQSVDGAPTEVTAIDQELTKLRAQLTDFSSRYTDSYPDVIKLKAQIARTEKQRDDLLAAPKTPSKQAGNAESTPLLQLQSQLQANQLEVANHERGIVDLQNRINEYQARLNSQPATEQELAELTRGYDQSKANYDDLLKKKNQSAMATSMEEMQRGERFTMLDPPSLPTKPEFPNRMKFCAAGIGAGLGLGCLVVFLFEFFDDRMHSEKEIKSFLSAPVLAEIPEIQSPLDGQRQKSRMVLSWALTVFVCGVILAASAFSYLRG